MIPLQILLQYIICIIITVQLVDYNWLLSEMWWLRLATGNTDSLTRPGANHCPRGCYTSSTAKGWPLKTVEEIAQRRFSEFGAGGRDNQRSQRTSFTSTNSERGDRLKGNLCTPNQPAKHLFPSSSLFHLFQWWICSKATIKQLMLVQERQAEVQLHFVVFWCQDPTPAASDVGCFWWSTRSLWNSSNSNTMVASMPVTKHGAVKIRRFTFGMRCFHEVGVSARDPREYTWIEIGWAFCWGQIWTKHNYLET